MAAQYRASVRLLADGANWAGRRGMCRVRLASIGLLAIAGLIGQSIVPYAHAGNDSQESSKRLAQQMLSQLKEAEARARAAAEKAAAQQAAAQKAAAQKAAAEKAAAQQAAAQKAAAQKAAAEKAAAQQAAAQKAATQQSTVQSKTSAATSSQTSSNNAISVVTKSTTSQTQQQTSTSATTSKQTSSYTTSNSNSVVTKTTTSQTQNQPSTSAASSKQTSSSNTTNNSNSVVTKTTTSQTQNQPSTSAASSKQTSSSNTTNNSNSVVTKSTTSQTETQTSNSTKSGSDSDDDDTNSSKESSSSDTSNKTSSTDTSNKSTVVEVEPPPPATVAEMFRNWLSSTPSQTTAQQTAVDSTSNVTVGQAATTSTAAIATVKPTEFANENGTTDTVPVATAASVPTPTPTGQIRKPTPLAMPAFPQEVLAVNAPSAAIESAKSLGFKTAPSAAFSNLDVAVTRLLPPDGMSVADARALLAQKVPHTQFALNHKFRLIRAATGEGKPGEGAAISSTEPCVGDRCFARQRINWRPELKRCATGLKIGIIDTSVDVTHPAFAHKNLQVRHLASSGKPGADWHGTGVTALLAGDANSSTPGLIPEAAFFVADIFSAGTDNSPVSDTVSMLRAFDWLDSEHVRIVNMSLAGPPDELIRSAIEKLSAKGMIFIAAAGNEGPNGAPSYPAAYQPVIAVTAVNKDLRSYINANRGSYIDLAAPGVAIWTALPGRKEGYRSGTSFAAPFVTAAVAALYPSAQEKSAHAILDRLTFKDLGEPGPDPIYGKGLMIAPDTCGGTAIAKRGETSPNEGTAVVPAAGFVTTVEALPAARPAGGREELPWLGLQGAN